MKNDLSPHEKIVRIGQGHADGFLNSLEKLRLISTDTNYIIEDEHLEALTEAMLSLKSKVSESKSEI
jgi:hypothetical protein